MSAEKYHEGGDLSSEEINVESHFFPGGVDRVRDQNSDGNSPDPNHLGYSESIIRENTADPNERARRLAEEVSSRVAAGPELTEGDFLYDEHSGRNERAAATEAVLPDERMDMRAEYNLHQYELTPDDRGMLERITDRGRETFDGLLNVPRIDRVAARFGMEFDQHFLDKSNKETSNLSVKVAQIDDRIRLFKQRNEAAAKTSVNNLAGSSLPDLLTRARNEKIDELQREKEQLMAKIGKHEADAKFSETNRNRYVDWMIRKNNERIAPLEAKKLRYQEDLRNFDEKNAPLTAHFQRLKNEVEDLEKEKINGIKEAEEAGLRGKELKDEIKKFDEMIKRRRKVLEEWEDIKRERARMEQKIAQLGAKISQADRSKEYQAILNKKPLIVASQPETAVYGSGVENRDRSAGPAGSAVEGGANYENAGEKFDAGDMLELWKQHFTQKVDKGFTIDLAIEDGKFQLAEGEQLTVAEFKQRLKDYYEARFPGATALLGNIESARAEFATDKEALRNELRESEDKKSEIREEPKMWIQDAIIEWNNFIQEQLSAELKNDADLGKSVLLNPGEFVRKDDVPQNVDFDELKAIVEKSYQEKPELSSNIKSRLEQEYQNFLASRRANQS